MILSADTSVLVAYFAGASDPTIARLAEAIENDSLRLSPVVVTELLSHPLQGPLTADFIRRSPVLKLDEGFWSRAGETRRTLLSKGLKARLPDTLIAQGCIDADVPLLALDGDFRHFVRLCGLKLA